MKPRIGIDARMYRRSTAGIGTYTRNLLRCLLPILDAKPVLFMTPADASEFERDCPEYKQAELVVCDIAHYSIDEQLKFPGILKDANLDLVHFLNFNHPLTYRGKFVITIHDLTLLHFPGHGGKKPNFLKHGLFKRVLFDAAQRSQHVIAISKFTADDVLRTLEIDPAKLSVIYEGGPEPSPVAQLQIPPKTPYFLFVSNWRPHKGLRTLLEAFHLLAAQRPDVELILVGNQEGASRDVLDLLERSPYRDRIKVPGFVDDLVPLFQGAIAFVFPSEREGFGLPILEAFAHGCPVIAANNSSLPEVVNGGGLLFETGNATALLECMNRILEVAILRSHLLTDGRAHLTNFSWEKCAQETAAVYRSVLN